MSDTPTREELCKVHTTQLSNIEKRLDEHGQQLKEHSSVYMKFIEKLTDMNENIVNLTKIESVNSQKIGDLTNTIERHIEATMKATKELSDKQDQQFDRLNSTKLSKEDYRQDIIKLKIFEENYEKH